MIKQKTCQSDSTARKIINHCSSFRAWNFYPSYSRPSMSQRWPNDCRVSWNLCVRTNSINARPRTKSLERIPQGRTGLPEWHSINTVSLSNYMNQEIFCTYFRWSNAYVHRGIERSSSLYKRCNGLGKLCGTSSNRIQISHLPPTVWGAKTTGVTKSLSINLIASNYSCVYCSHSLSAIVLTYFIFYRSITIEQNSKRKQRTWYGCRPDRFAPSSLKY